MICLFVSRNRADLYGGGVIGNRNLRMCQAAFDRVVRFLITDRDSSIGDDIIECRGNTTRLESAMASLKKYAGNSNEKVEKGILSAIERIGIDIVFFDGGYYGKIARSIRGKHPRIRIVTYHHNVELLFSFYEYQRLLLLYAPVLYSLFCNERLSLEYSNVNIAITREDSESFRRIYGLGCDFVIPASIDDGAGFQMRERIANRRLRLLFVGSRFFANTQGVKWFVRKVLPHVDCELTVAGNGFEKERIKDASGRLKVVGRVDDLAQYYDQADIVIAPLFCGSGMKVKIAEALMHNRKVIGTDLALRGYDAENDAIIRCNTKSDFIFAIKAVDWSRIAKDDCARKLFEAKYSDTVVIDQFASNVARYLEYAPLDIV